MASSDRQPSTSSTLTEEELDEVFKAVRNGDISTINNYITKYNVNDIRDPRRWHQTLLHEAALRNKLNVVQHLLDNKAYIEAPNIGGETALHEAASSGNNDIIQNLLDRGAKIDSVNKDGLTPLHRAAESGSVASIEFLLNKGAKLDHSDNIGQTALHRAAESGSVASIEFLLNKGAKLDHSDNDGETPLHRAAEIGIVANIECLLNKGAKIDHSDNDGNTPLARASDCGRLAAVKYLTGRGADVHAVNKEGQTPLLRAVNGERWWRPGRCKVVKYFIEKKKVDITKFSQEVQQEINKMIEEAAIEESDEDEDADLSDDTVEGLSHSDINKAYLESTTSSLDTRVAMMGTEGSGKTCLSDTLTGQDFQDTLPTEGANQMEVVVKSAVDWKALTPEELIDGLQQQMLHEAHYCATEKARPPQIAFTKSMSEPTTDSSEKPLSKPLADVPMLPLPSGDTLYFLTIEEFKQLPAMLSKYDPLQKYIGVWDYAGQSVFQHTHGLFISEEVVCLIVFDASKLLEDTPDRRYKDDDSPARSGLHTITYWMDLISCRVRKKSTSDEDLSEFLPTFILVGTHIDLLSPDIHEAREIAFKKFVPLFEKEFLHKPFSKHIAGSKKGRLFAKESSSVFFLSNRVRDPLVNAELQKAIIKASPKRSRPTRYVKVERKLMLLAHEEKLSVANFSQIVEVAKSCGISSTNEEVLKLLQYFHQKGTVLYFNEVPALKDTVILCPQWLAKLLTYVLTNLVCRPAGATLGSFANERSKEGLLRQELLEWCVEQFKKAETSSGSRYPDFTWGAVVELLLKFRLMVDVTNSSVTEKKKIAANKKLYLVPHLLPQLPFTPTKDPCYQVLYYFPGEFIPDSLVDQLIVKCVEWNGNHNYSLIRLSYRWVWLKLGKLLTYKLRVINQQYIIELTMIPKLQLSQAQKSEALANIKMLVSLVNRFIDDLMKEQMTATFEVNPVKCCLPCPQCSNPECIEMEVVKEENEVPCVTTGDYVDMTKYYKLFTQGDLPESGSTVISSAGGNSMTEKPEMATLIKVVVPRIAARWETVAHFLKFEISRIEIIRKQHPNDPEESCTEVFTHWLSTDDGVQPKTWGILLKTLNEIKQLTSATEEIKTELQKVSLLSEH